MKIEQKKWTKETGWKNISSVPDLNPQLILCFSGTSILTDQKRYEEIRSLYPAAHLLCCSTAGEIMGTEVSDETIAVTAIQFEKTTLNFAQRDIRSASESLEKGSQLTHALPKEGLVHVLVFSDGLKINGTALVQGMTKNIASTVSVTGGLVGDGANFKKTVIGFDSAPTEGKIVAVGLYGKDLKVGFGSLGGWDPFGPDRLITKSKDNVLFELDGKPALALYKEYLGVQAKGLPGTGLLFPLTLTMKTEKGEIEVVRTILAIDEKTQSITFAGDMPQGVYARLMKANFDRLIDGAEGAAKSSIARLGDSQAQLALLISCIGRKLVLKERIEEEIEAVQNIVGKQSAITGFYSYGEICPTAASENQCQLHNQTMTITTLSET